MSTKYVMKLSPDQKEIRERLVVDIASKFAKAAGYQLVEDNINQWRPAIETLIDGVLDLVAGGLPSVDKRGE